MCRLIPAVAALLGSIGCKDAPATTTPPPTPPASLRLETVATGLASPVVVTAPAGDARLFIVEQTGRIRIVQNGQLLSTPFLDLSTKISAGGERGLLGLAFHPHYATNGYLYVDYTDRNGDTQVERYHVSTAANVADVASAQSMLSVAQPFANHNGGMLLFAPDGKLYIGMGDGGSGGDPYGNGQSLATLLGKLLRIDVDRTESGRAYAIPTDNPFVSQSGARGEIWAYGLRNPWRFAVDRSTGLLYIADVGQGAWEEIDARPVTSPGLNYGWNVMEGSHCYGTATCSTANLVAPVLEYGHDQGCSIIGGYVYRGSAIPGLTGAYFYSDYCTGFLRSLRVVDGQATDQRTWDVGLLGGVLSFGEDSKGELYICTAAGTVYRIAPPVASGARS